MLQVALLDDLCEIGRSDQVTHRCGAETLGREDSLRAIVHELFQAEDLIRALDAQTDPARFIGRGKQTRLRH